MKKYRLSTTISLKHWSLLQKYSEKFETQQKAIEKALEYFDHGSPEFYPLSEEDRVWLRIGRELRSVTVLFSKDYFKVMIDKVDLADFQKYVDGQNPALWAIEYYHQKPIRECSPKEIVDGIIMNIKMQNSSDMVTCTDNDDYYEIYLTHAMGINASKMLEMMNVGALKTYGAKFVSIISERTVILRVYKNGKLPDSGGMEA